MKTVAEPMVARTWNRLQEAAPEEVEAWMDRMVAEQPFIGAYLMAVEEVWMAEDQRGGLLLQGLMFWQAMTAGQARVRAVTQEEIEAAEARNLQFLEQLEEGSEMKVAESLATLTATYNQAPLLHAVFESFLEGHGTEGEEAPDLAGVALLHLKTVLDCLDQAGSEASASSGGD